MARKSTLVYRLLISNKENVGLAPNEILKRVSATYNITPGKALKRQVRLALRRGTEFGILTRIDNKYKYDLKNALCNPIDQPIERAVKKRKKAGRKRKGSKRATKKVSKKKLSKPKSLKSKTSKTKPTKPNSQNSKSLTHRKKTPTHKKVHLDAPPKPRVPPPPTWIPERRKLRHEPIRKCINHTPGTPMIPY